MKVEEGKVVFSYMPKKNLLTDITAMTETTRKQIRMNEILVSHSQKTIFKALLLFEALSEHNNAKGKNILRVREQQQMHIVLFSSPS